MNKDSPRARMGKIPSTAALPRVLPRVAFLLRILRPLGSPREQRIFYSGVVFVGSLAPQCKTLQLSIFGKGPLRSRNLVCMIPTNLGFPPTELRVPSCSGHATSKRKPTLLPWWRLRPVASRPRWAADLNRLFLHLRDGFRRACAQCVMKAKHRCSRDGDQTTPPRILGRVRV